LLGTPTFIIEPKKKVLCTVLATASPSLQTRHWRVCFTLRHPSGGNCPLWSEYESNTACEQQTEPMRCIAKHQSEVEFERLMKEPHWGSLYRRLLSQQPILCYKHVTGVFALRCGIPQVAIAPLWSECESNTACEQQTEPMRCIAKHQSEVGFERLMKEPHWGFSL